eukprot:6175321-Pleurochrysis_carterae.AAC.2
MIDVSRPTLYQIARTSRGHEGAMTSYSLQAFLSASRSGVESNTAHVTHVSILLRVRHSCMASLATTAGFIWSDDARSKKQRCACARAFRTHKSAQRSTPQEKGMQQNGNRKKKRETRYNNWVDTDFAHKETMVSFGQALPHTFRAAM